MPHVPLNVTFEWLALLLLVQEVLDQKPGLGISCPD